MKLLFSYFISFLSFKRYSNKISLLAIWDSKSKIAKNTYLAMGVRLENSSVGEYSRIRHFCELKYTTVGKFSAIGRNVKLGFGHHPTNLISTNLIFYKKNQIKNDWVRPIRFQEFKPINIGHDVWIGENAMVMGGVNISHGAVVAAGSIVTKDIPPYAIVGGIPAKVLKYRFDEKIIAKLLEIKWWDLPDEEISKRINAFTIFDISEEQLNTLF